MAYVHLVVIDASKTAPADVVFQERTLNTTLIDDVLEWTCQAERRKYVLTINYKILPRRLAIWQLAAPNTMCVLYLHKTSDPGDGFTTWNKTYHEEFQRQQIIKIQPPIIERDPDAPKPAPTTGLFTGVWQKIKNIFGVKTNQVIDTVQKTSADVVNTIANAIPDVASDAPSPDVKKG